MRTVLALTDLNPHVAVGRLGQAVGQHFPRPLHLSVVELAADQPLDGKNRVLGIGHRLALGNLTDETLAVLSEGNNRRRGSTTFTIGQHLGR